MTIAYKSARRIQATSTDFAGTPAVTGGWKEVGRTTLGTAGDTISVTSLADKRYYMLLTNTLDTGGSTNHILNFNADTGNNYSGRKSNEGSSDGTWTSQYYIDVNASFSAKLFNVGYVSNLSTKEKLYLGHSTDPSTAGAGTAPNRAEIVGKHAQTTNPISSVQMINTAAGSYNTGSEVVVLGWDDSDTHTTNFWEELASVTQSGAGSSLDSGTITAKKYLWIQTFNPDKPSGNNLYYRFNSDTASNYANRYSTNGGADVTQLSVGNGVGCNYDPSASGTTAGLFMNTFIINNSANEKLCTTNTVSGWTNAGAGVAPARFEVSSKWANTTAQITSVQYNGPASSVSDGTIMKVWGSD